MVGLPKHKPFSCLSRVLITRLGLVFSVVSSKYGKQGFSDPQKMFLVQRILIVNIPQCSLVIWSIHISRNFDVASSDQSTLGKKAHLPYTEPVKLIVN